jgi:predicted aspartyl protease
LRAKTAAELKLPQLSNQRFRGVGGIEYRSQLTTVDTLTLSDQVLRDVQFIITPGGGAGSLGQNLLGRADVEYDFAHGALRLFKSDGCPGASMAYWVKGEDYSVLTINWMDERNPHTKSDAQVNGVPVSVSFGSGAGMSSLSLTAAQRIGLKVDGPGARYIGLIRGGGPEPVKAWIVPIDSFKIGSEEIRNTELRVIDEAGPGLDSDLTLGADFFLSHRIYVANSQHKLYFTYNGGPVFRLSDPSDAKP